MSLFKKYMLLLIILILATSCFSKTIKDNEESNQIETIDETIQEESVYPYELNQAEIEELLSGLEGMWLSYEFPYIKHIAVINSEFDDYVGGHIVQFKKIDVDGNTDDYGIWTDNIYLSLGRISRVISISRIDDKTYILGTENLYLTDPICTKEGDHIISYVKMTFLDNEPNEYRKINIVLGEENDKEFQIYYPEDSQTNYSSYEKWLIDNDHIVNYDWREEIFSGYPTKYASLYKAKEVVESLGLVFDTNISEEEWDNAKKYKMEFIIEGQNIEIYDVPVKKGTTAYFSYK